MAKVGNIRHLFKGSYDDFPVKCNSKGIFSVNLPGEVSEALDIRQTLYKESMAELEKEFKEQLERYAEAVVKHELCILIQYKANGTYQYDETGRKFLHERDYELNAGFGDDPSAIGFEYEIVLREEIAGVVTYFNVRSSKSLFSSDEKTEVFADKYVKSKKYFGLQDDNRGKIIPYSEEALNKLEGAENTLRKLSEFIHDFMEQDKEKIIEQLTTPSQLFLPEPKED